jgi:hypothetical protein
MTDVQMTNDEIAAVNGLVIGHWSLVIGHWSLVIGHWSLVIGHWSLVIGHWSLVIWALIGHSDFVIRYFPRGRRPQPLVYRSK